VLEVDGVDQFDVWSRFRMGYRGYVTERAHGEDSEWRWARATHNAYRRLGVPVVRRWMGCLDRASDRDEREDSAQGQSENFVWLCLDVAQASSQHHFANRIRIHPAFGVERVGESKFRLTSERQKLWLEWMCESGAAEIEDGWYCPEFGQRLRAPVITWRGLGTECRSAWVFSKVELPSTWQLQWHPSEVRVSFCGRELCVTL
jgi:uncharacterized heparinase superfamily protein